MSNEMISRNEAIIILIFNIAYLYPKLRLKVKKEKDTIQLMILDHQGHYGNITFYSKYYDFETFNDRINGHLCDIENYFKEYINLEELK